MADKKPIKRQEFDSKEERLAALRAKGRELNKKLGIEAVSIASDLAPIRSASFGIPELDTLTGGGIPHGNFTVLWGGPGCLAWTTIVPFVSKTKNGNFKGKKNQTIQRLYEIFHNKKVEGKGKYIRKESIDVEYYLPSVKEDGSIFLNKINDVIYSGHKEIFKLETFTGQIIFATADHLFLTKEGYKKLSSLKFDDEIFYNPKKIEKTGQRKKDRGLQILVKYHPYGNKIIINKNLYYRISKSHLVVEANMNNLSPSDYRLVLNNNSKDYINKLNFINVKTHEVHHKDRNRRNDSLNNLQLLTIKEHHKIHEKEEISRILYYVKPTFIKDIRFHKIMDTYDITMSADYPNFIAEDLVVHNSGKTSTAFKLASTAQKEGKIVYYIALEPLDTIRAQQFGVNLEELQIGRFPQAEMALDTIVDYARNKLVDVIILDSIHSLAPKGMQENSKGEKSLSEETMAILARKLSEFFKVSADPVKRSEVAVLLIGQTRMQVGFISIEALTGGNALHHAAKLIIRQRRGPKDSAPRKQITNDKGKKEEIITGFETIYKLDKVQVSGSKTEGSLLSLPYYYETGFDTPQYILDENKEIALALGPDIPKKPIPTLITENLECEKPLSETNPYAKDEDALKRSVESSTAIEIGPERAKEALKKKRGRPKKEK